MILLGFAGKAGSGKTTAARLTAQFIEHYWPKMNVPVLSIAMPIKEETERRIKAKEVSDRVSKRTINQQVGDHFRSLDPGYMTKAAYANAVRYGKTGIAIFDDIRRPDEAELMNKYGWTILINTKPDAIDQRVSVRDGQPLSEEQKNHSTEQSVFKCKHTWVITNDGDMEALMDKLLLFLKKIKLARGYGGWRSMSESSSLLGTCLPQMGSVSLV